MHVQVHLFRTYGTQPPQLCSWLFDQRSKVQALPGRPPPHSPSNPTWQPGSSADANYSSYCCSLGKEGMCAATWAGCTVNVIAGARTRGREGSSRSTSTMSSRCELRSNDNARLVSVSRLSRRWVRVSSRFKRRRSSSCGFDRFALPLLSTTMIQMPGYPY